MFYGMTDYLQKRIEQLPAEECEANWCLDSLLTFIKSGATEAIFQSKEMDPKSSYPHKIIGRNLQ